MQRAVVLWEIVREGRAERASKEAVWTLTGDGILWSGLLPLAPYLRSSCFEVRSLRREKLPGLGRRERALQLSLPTMLQLPG